jgi:large subunit ribosomal protein L20
MRVKRGTVSRRRHKAFSKLAKGFRGRRKNCFKSTKLAVEKSLKYAYRDRRVKKREFRSLWITRINVAAREHGISYSQLIRGLTLAGIEVNRKVLADLAVTEPVSFQAIVKNAQVALQ